MSYIQDYLKLCENTKPAMQYHVWSMLSTLSVFAGRRFWFPFGPLNYYPNLYVVLVGDPGNGKSTAMNFAKNIVRASGVCPVAATKMTKEAMSLEMANEKFTGKKQFPNNGRVEEYNQYAIFATELTQFISVDPLGFLDFLTTVWDEPVFEVKTKNKGNDYVMGPYITMEACMTPELVKGFLKMNILQGGFARRTAFCFAATKNIVHIPTKTQEQSAAELRCIQFGKQLQKRYGPFGWTPELIEYYKQWNQENEEKLSDRPPNTRGWFESKGEMLFKVSMLVALAEDPEGPLMLDIPQYRIAQRFLDMIESGIDRVFEGTGINPNAGAAAQICRMLEAMDKPMDKKKLMALFHDQARSINDLVDTINHLISVGRLACRQVIFASRIFGEAIATPECLGRFRDAELAAILQPELLRQLAKELGLNLEAGQLAAPPNLHVGSDGSGVPILQVPAVSIPVVQTRLTADETPAPPSPPQHSDPDDSRTE